MATLSRRLLVRLLLAVAVVAAGAVGLRALWGTATNQLGYDHCTVATYDLDTSQASVAASMVAAVSSFSPALPERAAVLVLAAGLQESKLRNLPPGSGDRDSVGVLQQRPSQGWGGGDPAKLQDVGEATTEFLDHLVKIDGWQRLPLTEAIQDVQISADGSAYAQHEDEATALAGALLGRPPAGISCSFGKPTKVASTAAVAQRVRTELPVRSAVAAGRTVTVPAAGWQTTAWFVANADRLGIDAVRYDGKEWTRAKGWHNATAPRTEVVATMASIT